MKKLLSLVTILIIGAAFASDASAHGWHRNYYRPRVYVAPPHYCASVPAPVVYCQRQYAPAMYRDVWVQPHWRHTPYGRQWIQGHWVRQRVY